MPRVKRGKSHLKRRKNILKKVKGYRWGNKNKTRLAKEAILHAGAHALKDRRYKKRVMRALWQTHINAALRPLGYKYSTFMDTLKKNKVALDRKILADLAKNHPQTLANLAKSLK